MNSTQFKERLKNRSAGDVYIRSGRIKARDGQADELYLILKEASEKIQAVDGNILCLVNREVQNRDMINIFELWESRDHQKKSLANSDIMLLFAKALILAETTDMEQM